MPLERSLGWALFLLEEEEILMFLSIQRLKHAMTLALSQLWQNFLITAKKVTFVMLFQDLTIIHQYMASLCSFLYPKDNIKFCCLWWKQHTDEEKIMNVVSVEKDVDGFHPLNMGNLAIKGREPLFIPCAPKACLELLLRNGLELRGKKVAVVGRSKIVGLPASLLLQRHHATVSVVHSFTENPERVTSEADIVVSDVGMPNTIRGHWLKPGAVVIDTGNNAIKDPKRSSGYCLVGDVCYQEAIQKVSAMTTVPGGVGPVTIAMLLSNTLLSAKRHYNFT